MIQLMLIELFKIIKRPRTYIGFLAIFLTVGAMQLAMYYEGEELISIAIQNLENDFRLEGKIINTNLMTYILLNSLIIHIPILICLVTGDSIAGEASSGTLRLILQKPYSRTQIYLAKALSGFIYTISLIIFLALMTYVLGYFLFGSGDLIVLRLQFDLARQSLLLLLELELLRLLQDLLMLYRFHAQWLKLWVF